MFSTNAMQAGIAAPEAPGQSIVSPRSHQYGGSVITTSFNALT
jgi:hypothetical protein